VATACTYYSVIFSTRALVKLTLTNRAAGYVSLERALD